MKLTAHERRRVLLAQQRTRAAMLAPVTPRAVEGGATGRRLRRALTTLALLALAGGAVAASRVVEFHPPATILDAFLPRS